MKWSLKLGSVSGIGIFLHWTFGLLIGWYFFVFYQAEQNVPAAIGGIGFILAVFGCIVLHELGHAFTARHYGIKTLDITLLPIGGLARLEKMPDEPIQELWVALAGPAVNVVISALAFGALWAMNGSPAGWGEIPLEILSESFLLKLLVVNVGLVIFNLLPAFPMDGGRVLRALLALKLEYTRATAIAANVGKFMAAGFGILAFFAGNPFLVMIAFFVYLGAEQERQAVHFRSMFEGLLVRDAMITHFDRLAPGDTLGHASRMLLAGSQQDFPVFEDGRAVGLLTRRALVKGLAAEGGSARTVGAAMQRQSDHAEIDEALEQVYRGMRKAGVTAIPVVEKGEFAGLLTLENIAELLMLRDARKGRRGIEALGHTP